LTLSVECLFAGGVVSPELQRLLEVPRNRLALAIGVGGQVDLTRARRAGLETLHNALAALRVLILKLVVRRGHSERFNRQVAHVADTGGNVPSGAQKGFDLLHLVRAFDNHQINVRFVFM